MNLHYLDLRSPSEERDVEDSDVVDDEKNSGMNKDLGFIFLWTMNIGFHRFFVKVQARVPEKWTVPKCRFPIPNPKRIAILSVPSIPVSNVLDIRMFVLIAKHTVYIHLCVYIYAIEKATVYQICVPISYQFQDQNYLLNVKIM